MQKEQELLIKELIKKVEILVNKHKKISEENKLLREKQMEMSYRIQNQEQDILNIQKQYDSLKIARIIESSSEDKTQAKEKVSKILREVDKCIALLNT